MRAASTSPQRTRSSMQYLRWSLKPAVLSSRRQVFEKFQERAAELLRPFDVRDVARAFDDCEARATNPFAHRLGLGRRRDGVLAPDDDERGNVYRREQVGLVPAQRHAAQRGGRALRADA